MKKFISSFVLAVLISISSAAPLSAAKPDHAGGGGADKGPRQSEPVGNDISWPQCGSSLPTTHAFGIVGVNGGTAAKTNPCLAEQLQWAYRAIGGTSQSEAQLYVNTANPGEVIDEIITWPTSNTDKSGFTTDNPYGTCSGANDLACSWQYGWNRSEAAVFESFKPAATEAGVADAVSAYTWWLDVETMNTWQAGSADALARNTAALEGFASYYQEEGAKVGLYSTNYQWGVIVGNTVAADSNLNGLDSWLAGARNLKGAKSNCRDSALTAGGTVTLTQYVSGSLDYDYSCAG